MNDAETGELLRLADEILAVLTPFGGTGVESAKVLRESIRLGNPPGRKLIEPVGDALLESLLKVSSVEGPAPAAAGGPPPIPSRQRVREVYKKFRDAVQTGKIA
jgi:hypothetical protein